MVDEDFAGFARADQQGRKAFGGIIAVIDVALEGALKNGVGGKAGERRLFRRLPDDGVAADKRQGGVPGPDGDGEVERRNDAADAKRVPGFHHAMLAAFGGDRQAVDLARQADGEIADVDHFLHFAKAFGGHLADFERDELAEIGLVGAKFFAKQADQFAALRCRNDAPGQKCLVCPVDGGLGVGVRGFRHIGDQVAGDRRMDGERAALIRLGIDAEALEEGGDLFASFGGFGDHVCFPKTVNR